MTVAQRRLWSRRSCRSFQTPLLDPIYRLPQIGMISYVFFLLIFSFPFQGADDDCLRLRFKVPAWSRAPPLLMGASVLKFCGRDAACMACTIQLLERYLRLRTMVQTMAFDFTTAAFFISARLAGSGGGCFQEQQFLKSGASYSAASIVCIVSRLTVM